MPRTTRELFYNQQNSRPASHPFTRKWAFFGVYNYLNKFLIVVTIRTLWKSCVHARNYTRTVLESAELSKIDRRLTSMYIDKRYYFYLNLINFFLLLEGRNLLRTDVEL